MEFWVNQLIVYEGLFWARGSTNLIAEHGTKLY